MLQRLDARTPVGTGLSDPFLSRLLSTYREYWLRSLRGERPDGENQTWLLGELNARVEAEGGKAATSLDALEPTLQMMVRDRGYHVLLGQTLPLRELMLWKTESERNYEVALPEGIQPVKVVFMDDFASLGWAGFATCDRHHSGGWTKPAALYAVRSAYDLESEDFKVSYLTHEAQHFADNRRFPKLQRQEELEYRAKLAELAMGSNTVHDLLASFAGNVSEDPAVPHSYANGRVVHDLGARLFPGAAPVWGDATVARINAAAAELLRENTAKLAT